ncbi:Stress responsive alpha-beta barrel domain-containing protein [Sodalis praecaptivus]|uniref:Stress responsive alpha-beta barrel domain-containing protein n=1 Tax=Sodalis praecaptivus TaxID=1239307 RepID=W0HYC1_9GAMM|nr:Dabb family protein [Sodalis praecaptivus]AHF78866.1 Stress responsive alpha-beta barrel domain-containing protein [Sodalis praecaptivus]
MIEHNVFLQFRQDASQETIQSVAKALLDMETHIPSIKRARWYDNLSREQRDKGFHHMIALWFEDRSALEAYLAHPHHQTVSGDILLPALAQGVESLLVFDRRAEDGTDGR